jgi:hypothetical protein
MWMKSSNPKQITKQSAVENKETKLPDTKIISPITTDEST